MADILYVRDLFMGIFEFFPKQTASWNYDRRKLHGFFYEQKDKHPGLLCTLAFYNGVDGVRCPELEEGLAYLRSLGLLSSGAPDFTNQRFSRSRMSRNRVAERFPDTKEIKELSDVFQDRFMID